MSARHTRTMRRQRAVAAADAVAATGGITYHTVVASSSLQCTVAYEGLRVVFPRAQVYAATMPAVGKRVAVHENDGELNIVGVSLGP